MPTRGSMVSQAERSDAVAAQCPLSQKDRTEKKERTERGENRERRRREISGEERGKGKAVKGRGKALPE